MLLKLNLLVTSPTSQIEARLKEVEIVVISAGFPHKPDRTRDDLFNTNTSIVVAIRQEAAKFCPKAVIAIISSPRPSTPLSPSL